MYPTRNVAILKEYEVSDWGVPLCAFCKHGHTEAAWSDRDENDGTCWNAGALVCGCPKFITPAVARIRKAEWERKYGKHE
jgi:hypothetical protein